MRLEKAENDIFVESDYIKKITDRAINYLNTGYAVHFKGPSGTGKTTLAMYISKLLDRPFQIMFGNEEFARSDLIGGNFGISQKVLHDNFIHSVVKHQIDYKQKWVDGRLMDACKNGAVLIYDEFTRSRPEANNVLLSILEEGVIEVPLNKDQTRFVKVHPDFRIIFTSNPEEYSGIYKAQDALKNRMITMDLDFPDAETELKIVMKNTNIDTKTGKYIVNLVRSFRNHSSNKFHPTIRASIMICNVLQRNNINPSKDIELTKQICKDILLSDSTNYQVTPDEKNEAKTLINDFIKNSLNLLGESVE